MTLQELIKSRTKLEDKIRSVAEHDILPDEWIVELGYLSSEIRLFEQFKKVA